MLHPTCAGTQGSQSLGTPVTVQAGNFSTFLFFMISTSLGIATVAFLSLIHQCLIGSPLPSYQSVCGSPTGSCFLIFYHFRGVSHFDIWLPVSLYLYIYGLYVILWTYYCFFRFPEQLQCVAVVAWAMCMLNG